MTKRYLGLIILLFVFSQFFSGCKAASGTNNSEVQNKSVQKSQQPLVSKIIFVDKQNACKCTRAKTENAWNLLNESIKNNKSISLEKVFGDVEPQKIEPFKAQQSFFAYPAIYFLDSQNKVIKLLQGEIDEQSVKAVINN